MYLGYIEMFHHLPSLCRCLVAKLCPTLLRPQGLSMGWRLLHPWDFPGKNTGEGYHTLLRGIFPTQDLNAHLLHWQADSLSLRHLGSPVSLNHLRHILCQIPKFHLYHTLHYQIAKKSPYFPEIYTHRESHNPLSSEWGGGPWFFFCLQLLILLLLINFVKSRGEKRQVYLNRPQNQSALMIIVNY